ncbi:hypothetical protein P3T76_002113 [Phytophthora citrophthora]|uniref:RxLR effector protein n=1 Tax=Phytophthora citrophthora TaxID=4793 RepID=A0AAD9GXY3_9STRA|nr:hypothetical protein P3T76_002113 [Phytophthora citrophthora]
MKIYTVATSVGVMLFLAVTASHALESRQLRYQGIPTRSDQQTGARILAGDGIEETADYDWNELLADKKKQPAKQPGTLVRSSDKDEERLTADARRQVDDTSTLITRAP